MFGSRPPHPNQERPPHPGQGQQGQQGQGQQRPPHPQAAPQGERNAPPLLTDRDSHLLVELLGDEQQAQALFGTLQTAPPELAALGFLMLRIYEKTRTN
ncbi:hypothetical protein [Chamaesiphon sp. OTE_75_metabat_556]|jgi:hypothetical protein|uniref:hypothetical protein n=1 Tax=Chamaesiphon sp. OTE_75_metabat_556 TaxID=2964692 RepID=UPI00286B6529|nr:hypothetical protein [Chamaesiphon sp. OTE_75_metabat_556]